MTISDRSPVLLDLSHVDVAASLLARVFQSAPDMRYLIDDDDKMLASSAIRFYKAVIRAGLLYGEVYTTPSLDGLAVWISPENMDFTMGILLRTGLLAALLSLGFGPLVRFVRSSVYVEKLQKQAISGSRWVLVFLGVEPEKQGSGIGGELIQPILNRAGAEGVPCYVESADERNLCFYRRHGFEIVQQGQVPNGGPQVWIMVRKKGGGSD